MEKTPIVQRYVERGVQDAIRNERLPPDHPMRELLEQEGQVIGREGSPYIRVPDGEGGWFTLEERIQQLKADPRFRDSIPNPAKVAKGDESALRDNFESIAKGTAVVE